MKKHLYLVQPCDKPDGFTTLPYSIGVLAAYAWQNNHISNNYELCDFIVDKTESNKWKDTIFSPDVVAFSCYIWNYEYNKNLARYIKSKYPGCKVIFGGHSIPVYNSSLLDELPYVDYLIHGEGEIPFQKLLLSFIGYEKESDIPNISFRDDNSIKYSYDETAIVSDYPSPYLMGLFDKLVNDPMRKCTATLETNRGCPFKCAYCDWGLNKAKLRMMNFDKVIEEIEWMGNNQIFGCNGADSNFGMFQRDVEIAKKIVETKIKFGFPKKFSVSFSKQSNERVIEISRILHSQNALAGVTLSFQSLNPKTLEIIGRTNLSFDYFEKLMVAYNSHDIPTYSEIILALPGETYDSFINGLCKLIELGQYRYINVYNFTLLPNSGLGQQREIQKYKIKTVKIPSRLLYCKIEQCHKEAIEHYDIVVETSTMSKNEWVECKCFTSVLKGFHSFGLTLYIATFLNINYNISYRSFYENLMIWIEKSNLFPNYSQQKIWFDEIAHERRSSDNLIDIYNNCRVPEEEAAFLKTISNIDRTYDCISPYLKKYMTIEHFEELFEFQKMVFTYFYTKRIEERTFHFDYISFFNSVSEGKKEKLIRTNKLYDANEISKLRFLPKIVYISKI